MRILPVLDLLKGQVVRGIAGRRQDYRPVVSRLTTSTQPLDMAQAFRDHFGLNTLYLADLDAIAGAAPMVTTYSLLHTLEFRLWVDAGITSLDGARPLVEAGVEGIVAGLETLADPLTLELLCRRYGGDRIIFSLDLRDGQPLGYSSAWGSTDPWQIAVRALASGVQRLIVLDLTRVGVGGGTGTEELCRRLATAYPQVELAAGGGIRDVADLRRLANCGVQTVLVASALHDGRLRREDLQHL